MTDEAIKPGDRVRACDKDEGTVLATLDDRFAWVRFSSGAPISYHVDNLTLIPPAPVAVSWRNVYATFASTIKNDRRADAEEAAAFGRLGVIVGYSDGTYKLEVTT